MADENRLSGGVSPETDMERLIELRPVFNQLRRLTMDAMRKGDKKSNLAYIKVRDILTAAPAVDAAPVVHGHWVATKVCVVDTIFACSKCSREVVAVNTYTSTPTEHISKIYPYCHCGAKMDGERENEA